MLRGRVSLAEGIFFNFGGIKILQSVPRRPSAPVYFLCIAVRNFCCRLKRRSKNQKVTHCYTQKFIIFQKIRKQPRAYFAANFLIETNYSESEHFRC